MHQENQAIRCRCFYLFNRFVFTSRMQLQQHLSPENVTSICSSVQDLLTIEASVPEPESPGDDVLTKAARKGSFFDSQLYLFEALGTLMSTLGNHEAEQVGLLRVSIALCRACVLIKLTCITRQALLQPLLSDISAAASASNNEPEQLLRLHHLIKAVGNVAHGFPEIKSSTHTPSGEWIKVFLEAMRVILDTLKNKNTVLIIREAVSRSSC
jgi:exportin-T